MSVIQKLSIHQFRNFHNQFLELNPNINFFIADNAQGKTNLIEAIYYLAHNRSFKSPRTKELISFDTQAFQINAKTNKHKIKLEKSNQKTTLTIDDVAVKNTSELGKILPVQVIAPDKGFVVNGTPKNKRSYLDWGVFHVKQETLQDFKNYTKTLKNINYLLSKQQAESLDFWFLALAKYSVEISKSRSEYIENLKIITKKTTEKLAKNFEKIHSFDYVFKSGWPKEVDSLQFNSIYQYLLKNKQYLLKNKQLNSGSHKASIKFFLNQKQECFLSRGEQKTLSIIFWLSQVAMLVERHTTPIVLIDDLSSELDNLKIKTILQYLDLLGVQVLITSINKFKTPNTEKSYFFTIKKGVIERIKN
jgi:DNA replication and repair protein RecF